MRISFVIRRGRRLDADNAASSTALKAALDGIVEAGLLKDDSLLYCERGDVMQETGKQYRLRPEVVVILEPVGERGSGAVATDAGGARPARPR